MPSGDRGHPDWSSGTAGAVHGPPERSVDALGMGDPRLSRGIPGMSSLDDTWTPVRGDPNMSVMNASVCRNEASVDLPQRSIGYGSYGPMPTGIESETTRQLQRQPREFHTALIHNEGVDENIGRPINPYTAQTYFNHPVADRVVNTSDVSQVRSTVNSVGTTSGLSSYVIGGSALSTATFPNTTAGECVTSVVDCQEQWERDATYRQSPELQREGHYVHNSRGMPTYACASPSLGTDKNLITEVDANCRPSLVNKGTSEMAFETTVTGIDRPQYSPVFGVARRPPSVDVPSNYSSGFAVPVTKLGGRTSAIHSPLHSEGYARGVGHQVPSPVVPVPRPSRYHSSDTDTDSVRNDVHHVFDPHWRDRALYQFNSNTVPCVRQHSTSSVDSLGCIVICPIAIA